MEQLVKQNNNSISDNAYEKMLHKLDWLKKYPPGTVAQDTVLGLKNCFQMCTVT